MVFVIEARGGPSKCMLAIGVPGYSGGGDTLGAPAVPFCQTFCLIS